MIRTNSLNTSVSSKGTMLTFKSLYKATPHTRIRGLSNIPNFHSNEDFPGNLSIARNVMILIIIQVNCPLFLHLCSQF